MDKQIKGAEAPIENWIVEELLSECFTRQQADRYAYKVRRSDHPSLVCSKLINAKGQEVYRLFIPIGDKE